MSKQKQLTWKDLPLLSAVKKVRDWLSRPDRPRSSEDWTLLSADRRELTRETYRVLWEHDLGRKLVSVEEKLLELTSKDDESQDEVCPMFIKLRKSSTTGLGYQRLELMAMLWDNSDIADACCVNDGADCSELVTFTEVEGRGPLLCCNAHRGG